MNNFFTLPKTLIPTKKRIHALLCGLLCIFLPFCLSACQQKNDYFAYVSECRSNIFIGASETLSLRAYATQKESPYLTDGIPCEKQVRTEIYVSAPSADKTCMLAFQVGDATISGEMSYDNVKGEYFFAQPIDTSALVSIEFTLTYGEENIAITAQSVRTSETLSPKEILARAVESASELFQAMTDEYGFTGEIYMRLLYEDAPFYYVGVIDRSGKVTAFLWNANTGKLLAKREP